VPSTRLWTRWPTTSTGDSACGSEPCQVSGGRDPGASGWLTPTLPGAVSEHSNQRLPAFVQGRPGDVDPPGRIRVGRGASNERHRMVDQPDDRSLGRTCAASIKVC